MIKLLIFGTGISAEKVLLNIRNDTAGVVGYLDNNKKKQGVQFKGAMVYAPEKCPKLEYDYIIIASVKYEAITRQLLEIGVTRDCIIPYFKFEHMEYEKYRGFLYIDGMHFDEMNLKMEHMQKYLTNMQYEVADRIHKEKIQIPNVLTIDETIDAIMKEKISISRYGDGEFDQIYGRREQYQEPDSRLSERLKKILTKPIEGHAVALADIYGDLSHLEDKYADYFRNVLIKYRQAHYQYIDMNRTYYNAFVSRLYSEMKDKSTAGRWFLKLRKIWKNRNVVIVEGDKTRFGVGNDLLDGALSVQRILCPAEGAFQEYDKILKSCLSRQKQDLYLLALGPTATVLAYDLAAKGYQALDVGHLDIEYEWYLRGVEGQKVVIAGKYTNEVVGGDEVEDIHDASYETQIVERI